jgi:hypothetical protein
MRDAAQGRAPESGGPVICTYDANLLDANLAADILRTHRLAIISDGYGNTCCVLDGWRRRCSLPVQRPYLLPQIESSLERIISDNDPGVGEMHQAVHNQIVTRPIGRSPPFGSCANPNCTQ